MKKLYLSIGILLLAGVLLAQSPWHWGASFQLGQSGEQVDEARDFGRPGVAYSNSRTYSSFAPSFAVGGWIAYRLSPRWSLQAGLQYRRLLACQRQDEYRYDATDRLTRFQSTTTDLRQQSLEVPLRLRYYLAGPERRLRSFLSIQAAPAYLLTGEELLVQSSNNLILNESTVMAYRYTLDFSDDYVRTQPWQLTYGAEIGLQWREFALSLTHNRTVRASRLDYDVDPSSICCFGNCVGWYDDSDGYNPYTQTRILRNTNLQLQYQF